MARINPIKKYVKRVSQFALQVTFWLIMIIGLLMFLPAVNPHAQSVVTDSDGESWRLLYALFGMALIGLIWLLTDLRKKLTATRDIAGQFKGGKAKPLIDDRTITFRSVLRADLPAPPVAYNVDDSFPSTPLPMFANDRFGCCVIAARAHQTLRQERKEQGRLLKITDDEVVSQYLKESGGADVGLVMLKSLNTWRKAGWVADKENYKIRAYASLDPYELTEIKRAISLNLGVQVGMWLPNSAFSQFDKKQVWKKSWWGWPKGVYGHAMYVTGYRDGQFEVITWGARQLMTEAYFKKYCDEAYVTIDAENIRTMRRDLRQYLDGIALRRQLKKATEGEKK